jgi:hypothetical protein
MNGCDSGTYGTVLIWPSKSIWHYDFRTDKKGVWQWDEATERFTERYPLQIAAPETEEKFFAVIELVLDHFQLFVEEQTFTKQQGFWRDTTIGKPP